MFDTCCRPLIAGERPAATAIDLMRSRFTAFATGAYDYLDGTWHPDTRPAVGVGPTEGLTWVRLEVVASEGGGAFDRHGTVEFRAHYQVDEDGRVEPGTLHERSRFARVDDRWVYVDGDRFGSGWSA